ncbi:hypothetical protein H920_12441 [Fukomys damarensis]|uniref:Uncharacterized protein n=1 Tax=Fukomys damarensis TaxID=885580 RepID=A0A091D2G6_FUKDA|nr:hypothetical protein H920_12441 [Fukomys damarensis]
MYISSERMDDCLMGCDIPRSTIWIPGPQDHEFMNLCLRVKMTRKGKLMQDIKAARTGQQKTLMKEDVQNCFKKRQERQDKDPRCEEEEDFEADSQQYIF